jgi:hypothetical protein
MLSTTTTALSTSMPTASSSPIIDRMFKVMPNNCRHPSVITKQIGIASDTISVEGQSRRKKNSTKIESSVPLQTGLAELVQTLRHRRRLIAKRVDLDALQLRFLANTLDLGHYGAADLDQIGAALLRDIHGDGRPLIQMPRIVRRPGLTLTSATSPSLSPLSPIGIERTSSMLRHSPTGCTW